MHDDNSISIWFFIGLLVLIYGVMILGVSLANYSAPSDVVMADLHVGVWWGALLVVIGALYVFFFRPGRAK